MGHCEDCFSKQRQIDLLNQEIESLREKLKYRKRREKDGFFGSSTPSSKRPVKANTTSSEEPKPKGAKAGHDGHGRRAYGESDADVVVDVPVQGCCPQCGCSDMADAGGDNRSVLEASPVKARKVLQRLQGKVCRGCGKRVVAKAKGVLPKCLIGNQLLTNAVIMHYEHGVPLARVAEQLGVNPSTLVDGFQRLARVCSSIPDKLAEEYRQSPVMHADETPWRTNGQNGYAWLFATERLSLFFFRDTRSSSVPRGVFGKDLLPGVLCVDRYAGYNRMPCRIQYCYAHLLREVQDLEKEFPDSNEIRVFVSMLAPLLATAMALRNQPISDDDYYRQAADLERHIRGVAEASAQHLGIRHIQDIFRDNDKRLYHWVTDRRVAAENNRAERDLRPTVIARKVSFGSQSESGAQARSVLMSVVHTMRKRNLDTAVGLCSALNALAENPDRDLYHLLFQQP